jgi:hypothetical protein
MRIGLIARDVGEANDLLAVFRIDAREGEIGLEFVGIPKFASRNDRLVIPARSCDRRDFARTENVDPLDRIGTQIFAAESSCYLIVSTLGRGFK